MQFKEMYDKPIDRPIDAVVKASSVDKLANELEEYVVTAELAGHLNRFFDEYSDPDATGNGAWISGFFGSGKSHMLKILAVVLQDQEVNGKLAFDYILPKVADDPSLRSAMEVARAKHPSESVLFNIDSIAPNTGRSDSGALLAAFIKAFNQHCGYFDGDQQHIAKLEYDLDHEGKLEPFKEKVLELTGKEWIEVRKAALLYAGQLSQAFDVACGNPAGTTENVVRYYQQTYKPDIHSFAVRVGDYIAEHERGFRLNFFVDEVGQFIAKNTSLMVNLQSVAEELNSVCGGDSWVIVTSQENMEDIVGEMSEGSANDFSKIQARFKIKMQLTSKDACTVIQQRLLAKSKPAVAELEAMNAKYSQDFRVLFDFADGSKRYNPYSDEEDFVSTYPFVPYQFDLFITAMRGLSDYNCFTGKHHSTGARSMLGVFQIVATKLNETGSTENCDLATFDAMFEGLRNSLKSEVYAAVSIAETHLASMPMAVRVLKALLLVKYCKDFRATPGNLRVLLYGSFRQNTSSLEQEIKDALAELERQLYIKRNAETNAYEYLTDEEKDIEKEIRNTEVSVGDVREEIAGMMKDLLGAAKANYKNGSFAYAFPYDLKIDGDVVGRPRHDLSLNLVTEAETGDLDVVPCPAKTLAVVLRGANDYMNGVSTFVKTRKYVQVASTAGEVRQAVIQDKRAANNKLVAKLRDELGELLAHAKFIAGGVDVTSEVSGSGKAAVECALALLVKRSYTNLQQVKKNYGDDDVYNACLMPQTSLAVGDGEHVQSVLGRIGLLGATTVTVGGDGPSSLMTYFTKNEYGWPEVAVRHAVACLYAKGQVEIRKGGSVLKDSELALALKSSSDMDKLTVAKVDEVTPEQIAAVTKGYRDLTGQSPVSTDVKGISTELEVYLDDVLRIMNDAKPSAAAYPFENEYAKQLELLDLLRRSMADRKWLVCEFPAKASEFASVKKSLSDMKAFIEGSPAAKKWQAIKAFKATGLDEARSLGIPMIAEGQGLSDALAVLEDPECYRSASIPRAAQVVRRTVEQTEEAKGCLREAALDDLARYRSSFEESYDLSAVDEDARRSFAGLFDEARARLADESSVYSLKTFIDSFKQANGARIVAILTPALKPEQNTNDDVDSVPKPDGGTPKRPETVQLRSIETSYGKPALESERDVEAYIEALRSELLSQIASGKIILR